MVQTVLIEAVNQRSLDMLLPDQFLEIARPPFAG
jgi:hypothetical protein